MTTLPNYGGIKALVREGLYHYPFSRGMRHQWVRKSAWLYAEGKHLLSKQKGGTDGSGEA